MPRSILVALMLGSCSFGQYSRGVNLAGADFGENNIPGVLNTHYTYNSEASFRYFAAKNLSLIRIPLRWERIQPALSGALDPVNLGALRRNIEWAKAYGAKVIIDIHNYGRYKIVESGVLNTYVIDNRYNGVVKVTASDLADLWVRLSNEFGPEAAVYGYGLMNEPHDMGTASWKAISQTVVTAIRNNGDSKLILVPGDSYSGADRWPEVHGPASWIFDPLNHFAYEAHQYFDRDNSGTYVRTYNQELALNPNLPAIGQVRLSHFVDWCKSNNVTGFLGEYGIPNNDARWDAVLETFLIALDTAGFDGAYWAAGEWWGAYPLSVQPQGNFTIDRPQLPTLLKHLTPGAFTSVSAASVSGLTLAPDSLVTGFGTKLAREPQSAGAGSLPLSLAGTQVELTDSTGRRLPAPLVYVSPSQINYLVPAELAPGRVDVSVTNNGTAAGAGTLQLEPVAPALFSANGDGRGMAAAQIVRVKPGGGVTWEPVAAPIDFGDGADRLFLILYGTGIRNGSGPSGAILQIGAATVPVSYANRQPEFPGLDQVNAELPRALIGAGEVTVTFKMDGKAANPVTLTFR